MIAFTLVSISLLLFSSCGCQNAVSHGDNQARYDYYRLYRVHIMNMEQVEVLQKFEELSDSSQFMGHARHTNQFLQILVAADKIAFFTDILYRYEIEHEILTFNFQANIDDQWKTVKPKTAPASDYDWDHYFYLETIHLWLDKLSTKYPEAISKIHLGDSYEGRPIIGVKLSKEKNQCDKEYCPTNKTAVFVEGGIHAREWISPATATYVLNELLTSNDSSVQYISENFDWYFFPVVNPDGYSYTFESDRMWRKTRKPYGLCRGTDLNRNFNYHWNETGCSADPCRYDFSGSHANSEPEAKLISEFIESMKDTGNIKTYFALHSYSQLIMFPDGHTDKKIPNYNDYKAISDKAVQAILKKTGNQYLAGSSNEIIYPTSGSSADWAYGVGNIPISFTIELRGPTKNPHLFVLPAEQIIPTGIEMIEAFRTILMEAKQLGYYN